MDVAKSSSFFQFPIRGLFQNNKPLDDVSWEERKEAIQRIISATIVNLGESLQSSEHAQEEAIRYAEKHPDRTKWFDCDNDWHIGILVASRKLNVLPAGSDNYYTKKYLIPYQNYGSMLVRVRGDLLWEYHDNKMASWREFAVLSAIYSGIGKQAYTRLSYERIRCMAMGYNGIDEWKTKGPSMKRKDPRLTPRQTEYTVKKLYERGLFVRACPNRRHVYYSHKLSEGELEKSIAVLAVKKKTRADGRGARDNALRQRIADAVALQRKIEETPAVDSELQELLTLIERRRAEHVSTRQPR